jgi:mono/diheme cytochrome c family protein
MPIDGGSEGSAIRRAIGAALAFTAIFAAPAPASASGDVLNGLSLAQLMCTRCHTIGVGHSGGYRGPPLPQTVNRKALDADALRAWLNEAHPQMPNFSQDLSPQQIEDIAAYLETFRVR